MTNDTDQPSYHDVVVFINGKGYRLFDCSYGLRLTCTRAGGWELWNMWEGVEELLGGEFDGKTDFRIEVRGVIICQGKPSSQDTVMVFCPTCDNNHPEDQPCAACTEDKLYNKEQRDVTTK